MATIKDISRKTGLGLATISKYLNGGKVKDTNREAIEYAINELGYTVNGFARSLRLRCSKTIGIVVPDLNNIFISSIIVEMEDILRQNGYMAIICDCRSDIKQEKKVVQLLMSKQVDSIVNMPINTDGTHLEPAIKQKLPIVLIDRIYSQLKDKVNAVLLDNISAAFCATSEFIKMGHKNIGIILGPRNIFTSNQRYLGYYQAMLENSLVPLDEHIIYSNYTVEGGYESMYKLFEVEELTAVFVTNYYMTLGAVIAINERSVKIPDEISIIGFDNHQLYQVVRPKLTIISQPLADMGRVAAEILLESMANKENPPQHKIITLASEIFRGDSVKDLRQHTGE